MGDLCTLQEWMAGELAQQFGQTITYPAGSGDGATGSRRVCGFSAPHHLARPWAITLGPPSRNRSPLAVGATNIVMSQDQNEAVAVLTFGTGGFLSTLEIDWRQGGVYTVVGSAITVACRMPVAAVFPITIGAFVTPSKYQVPNAATKTEYLGQIQFGASAFATVPRGARRVTVIVGRGNPNTDIPYTLEWFRANGTKVGDQEVAVSANATVYVQSIPLPVPAQASYVEVTNQSGATSMQSVQLMYELAI